MRRWIVSWGPALAWATILFLLSELRSVPRVVTFANNDKLIHFGMYAVLGGLLAWGQHGQPIGRGHAAPLAAGYFYGAVDELHQRFVPYRMPSWGDWTADVFGVSVGYTVVLLLLRALHGVRARATRS